MQGDSARLIYVHVPAIAVAYLAFGVTALGSVMWLWKRTRSLSGTASPARPPRSVSCSPRSLLVTGMIWGRPTWGVYWTWDARLTTTSLLFLLFLGYLALRRVPAEPRRASEARRDRRLLAFVDVPIVYLSVEWWRTLHQDATLCATISTIQVDGIMLFTLFLGFVVFTLDLRVAAGAPLPRRVVEDEVDEHRSRARDRGATRRRDGDGMTDAGWILSACGHRARRHRCVRAARHRTGALAREAGARRTDVDLTPRTGPDEAVASAARTRAPPPGGRKLGVSVVLALVLAAGGVVLFQGLNNATLYFRNADEAVAKKAELGTSASACRARSFPARS